MKRDILEQLLAARANRQGVALITNLDNGEQRLVPRSAAAAAAFRVKAVTRAPSARAARATAEPT